jgi:NtrC-family two-component system response regulator AlgB
MPETMSAQASSVTTMTQPPNEVADLFLIGTDETMRRVLEQACAVARSDATVLVRGESGTGKGLLARAVHGWSRHASGPFVTVSCPSLSPTLLESELFGHALGAFTGAVRDVTGKVAAAEGGTLFLDEVGDLPATLQVKLLRFLQDRTYERLGETASRSAQVRLVSATNADLEAALASGGFRQDLFHRISSVELTLPPLRSRSDFRFLAESFLRAQAGRQGRAIAGFTADALEALTKYAWPGNIRELNNAIERAVILSAGPSIGRGDLPERILAQPRPASRFIEVGRRVTLEELEAEHIARILHETASLDEAAQVLGIDRSTLYRKRRKYGL